MTGKVAIRVECPTLVLFRRLFFHLVFAYVAVFFFFFFLGKLNQMDVNHQLGHLHCWFIKQVTMFCWIRLPHA